MNEHVRSGSFGWEKEGFFLRSDILYIYPGVFEIMLVLKTLISFNTYVFIKVTALYILCTKNYRAQWKK